MADGIQGQELVGKLVEPAPEVLTFVGPDGEDLRSYIVELNRLYADSTVARNRAVPVVQELQRIYGEIQERGVSRETMESLQRLGEHCGFEQVAFESAVPMNAYTQRRSMTNQKPALEAVGVATAGLVGAVGAGAIYLLYKMIKWLVKIWKERGDKPADVKEAADKAAAGADGVMADPQAHAIMSRISNATSTGEAADLVVTTFSKLVSDFGDLPGGSERELGNITNQIDSYMDKAGQLFDRTRDITQNMQGDKALSDDDIAKVDDLCKSYANVIDTAWPAWKGLFSAYGVSIGTMRLAATGVNIQDVGKAMSDLKAAMEKKANQPGFNVRKFGKHEMELVQRTLKAVSKNLDVKAGYFPDTKALDTYLEQRTKSIEGMTKVYDDLRKEPKPESAAGLAHLADLNQLCSIYGKLLVDYAATTQYLLSRINAFVAACNKYLTVYTDTVNGKSTANNGKPASDDDKS